MACEHSAFHADAAFMDGLCPICLSEQLAEERTKVAERDRDIATLKTSLVDSAFEVAALTALLTWLNKRGGLGLDVHEKISAAIATKEGQREADAAKQQP